jgi:hypothetical protein
MKYLLINQQTGEETLCDKVTVDGFDYYVTNINPIMGSKYFDDTNAIRKVTITDTTYWSIRQNYKSITACTNPILDIPQVVDDVQNLAFQYCKSSQSHRRGFIDGYHKSQETHPFSEEDMVEFAVWLNDTDGIVKQTKHIDFAKSDKEVAKELLQLWKSQQPKKVYYNLLFNTK